MKQYEGIIPVMKPSGYTSHDVVAVMRRMLAMKRIGHTGTLDPQVTGVLPLCLGRATRLVEYMQDVPKEYVAQFRIGLATDTEDLQGTPTQRQPYPTITEQALKQVILQFTGEIVQKPPMYSAVKVKGKRLYQYAREGIAVERAARTVTIHEMELLAYELNTEYPEVKLRVRCSKGTYIRTLCKDIGQALGYPAVMSELVRTSTAHIMLHQCWSLDDIRKHCEAGTVGTLILPIDYSLKHIPRYTIPDSLVTKATYGQKLSVDIEADGEDSYPLYRVYTQAQTFLGLYTYDVSAGLLIPRKIFLD